MVESRVSPPIRRLALLLVALATAVAVLPGVPAAAQDTETYEVSIDATTITEAQTDPVTVTVTRLDPSALAASLSLTISPEGQAALSSLTITFAPGEGGSKSVQITALDDLDAEDPTDITVLVDLDVAGVPTRVAESAPITVVDDAGVSTVASFSFEGASEVEEGGSIDVLGRLVRSGSDESDLVVDLLAPPGLLVTPDQVVIPRGLSTVDVPLTIAAEDNAADDGDRLVEIGAGDVSISIVIVDNDVETFTVSGPTALAEDDSVDITITRLNPSDEAVEILLSVAGTGRDLVEIVGVPTVSFGGGIGGDEVVSLVYPADDIDDDLVGVVVVASIGDVKVAESAPIGLLDDDVERLRLSTPNRVREGTDFQVLVTRLSSRRGETSYPVSAAGGDGFDAADLELPSEIVFADGETTQAIRVTVVDDGRDESDETFAVTVGTAESGTITIIDDDEESYVLTAGGTVLPEGGQVGLVIERRSPTAADVMVNLSAVGTGGGLVRFLGTVPVSFVGGGPTLFELGVTYDQDLIDDDDSAIVIIADIGGEEIARSEAISLIDDDTETLTVRAASSLAEGESTTVSVSRTQPRRGEQRYAVTITGEPGITGDDISVPEEVVFADGVTATEFSVTAVDDGSDESDEVFSVVVGGASSDAITIVDNDDESYGFFVSQPSISEGDGRTISLQRVSPSQEVAGVLLEIVGAGGELVRFRDGAGVSFDAGVGTPALIRLLYPNDNVDDPVQEVRIVASVDGVEVARSAAISLIDDDTETLSFITFPDSVVEGDDFDVVVERRFPKRGASGPYPLRYVGTGGFDTSDLDDPPAEFTFADGSITTVLTVATVDDTIDEDTEEFLLRSGSVETGTIKLLDNDDDRLAPVADVDPVPEGGSAVITLSRVEPSADVFVVDLVAAGAGLTVTPAQVRWEPLQADDRSITVTVVNDRIEESEEQQILQLFINGDTSPIIVPIPVIDDDDAGSASSTSSVFTVHAAARTAEVSVRRQAGANGRFDGPVTVAISGNGAAETLSWRNGVGGVRRVTLDLPQGPGSTPLQYLLGGATGGLDIVVPGFAVAFDPNDAPVAVDDQSIVAPGQSVVINVLGNDRDPDLLAEVPGAPELSVVPTSPDGVTTARGGRYTCTTDDCTYQSSPGFIGTDTFDYLATDGLATDDATVIVCVGPESVCGQSDDFLLIGPFRAGLPPTTVYLQTLGSQGNGIFDQGSGSDGAEIHLSAISSTVSILDSGSGANDIDTTTVVAGPTNDDLVVTGSLVIGGPKSVRFDGMEELIVDGGAGDDTIEVVPGPGFRAAVNNANVTIIGGDGSDEIIVNSPDAEVEVDAVRGIVTVAGLGPIILESIEEILVSDPLGTRSVVVSGYWMVAADGTVYEFGSAVALPAAPVSGEAVDIDATADGFGAWVLDSTGDVHPLGTAAPLGDPRSSSTQLRVGENYVGLAPTASGVGYWVFTSQGRVLPFGDAQFFGDLLALTLNGPVLDAVPTESGLGYWMLGSDGGVFAFGDAEFYGSLPGIGVTPNQPTVGLVPDPDGVGYWFVASDGGVFAFDANFRGSMGAVPLNRPVNGMIPFGNGYVLVADDGGAFVFSDLPFVGSLGGSAISSPIVALSALSPF